MGFLVDRVVTLEFEGFMAEAEVSLRPATVETMEALRVATMSDAIPLLVDHLISWNLEYGPHKEPVPMTEEGIRKHLEKVMVMSIIGEWYKVAVGISAPLDPPSSDGHSKPDTVLEVPSIPMETL